MTAVLGIDAAWTPRQPSGVALVEETPTGWVCRALAPSAESFIRFAEGEPVDWDGRFPGSRMEAATLVEASEKGWVNGDGELAWGDHTRMIELTELIAQRNGISLEAVEVRAGQKALEKTPAGQYVDRGSGWEKQR